MSSRRIGIIGAGIVSALGNGLEATLLTLHQEQGCLAPLTVFPLLQGRQLPAGQAVFGEDGDSPLPRTHQLALQAAAQALVSSGKPPDAVILGCTTGGMLSTENLLERAGANSASCRYHGLQTVTAEVARFAQCTGPALTVSTACSSGALALALALRLLRSGRAKRVLAGGVDSLCRLTFFGFHSLQLVDASGPRPMDLHRRGMAVAEGAAMLLLSTEEAKPWAELLGAGLSCDAYHPASPHPQGDGALAAMQAALADAGLAPGDIDYINLHGTGTVENDLAEARAIQRLFDQDQLPPLSSIKGASGHSLAAAGAIEAVVAMLALQSGLIPANTGFSEYDPAVGLWPQARKKETALRSVLSNSFGFGGNNGSLVFAAPGAFPGRRQKADSLPILAVHGAACLTGRGDLAATLARLDAGQSCLGLVDEALCSAGLPARQIRRLKRLARMSLALATAALAGMGHTEVNAEVDSVFLGTGWGALSETADFLARLGESGQQFPSPTDFIGSVHNSPAGQIALMLGAKGANVTTSGAGQSFAQACYAAQLLACKEGKAALLLGADEFHPVWTPMLDAAASSGALPADGGGSLLLKPERDGAMAIIERCLCYASSGATSQLVADLGGAARLHHRIGLILADYPPQDGEQGRAQLEELRRQCGPDIPVWQYRQELGQFASASAVAAVLAVSFVHRQSAPALVAGSKTSLDLTGKSVLLLGLGSELSAIEFTRP